MDRLHKKEKEEMAVAKQVSNVEARNLDWMEIEDEDGVKYRYAKGRHVPNGSELHVTWDIAGSVKRARLVRDAEGRAVLRQNEPGLPPKIVMDYIAMTPTPPGLPVFAGWESRLEYELVTC